VAEIYKQELEAAGHSPEKSEILRLRLNKVVWQKMKIELRFF
jgi:hypothetical protein